MKRATEKEFDLIMQYADVAGGVDCAVFLNVNTIKIEKGKITICDCIGPHEMKIDNFECVEFKKFINLERSKKNGKF